MSQISVFTKDPMPSTFSYRYCAGTMPWGNPGDHREFEPQRHDDGYIEVIGFTMASLVSVCGGRFLHRNLPAGV